MIIISPRQNIITLNQLKQFFICKDSFLIYMEQGFPRLNTTFFRLRYTERSEGGTPKPKKGRKGGGQ